MIFFNGPGSSLELILMDKLDKSGMKEKDILCVVDFSMSSLNAMAFAFEMAGRTKGNVIVLFCYRLMAALHDEETASRKRKIEEEALMKFKEFEKEHLAGKRLSYKFVMESGFPHYRIEMFLEKNPARLLVLGSSVAQNFDEYKSVGFEKFAKSSKIPVVLVPYNEDYAKGHVKSHE